MLKAIYTPMSGAIAQERVLEILANNIANVSTNGFKQESLSFSVVDPQPYKHYRDPLPPANFKADAFDMFPARENEIRYVALSGVGRDTTQGPAVITNNPLDLSIQGAGYFGVMTTEGERYTRDGSFALSSNGVLMASGGGAVQGERGAIVIGSPEVEINGLGEVYDRGQFVDRIKIYEFQDERELERVGTNLYDFGGLETNRRQQIAPSVRQGMLEGSNVSVLKNMTQMILAHRSYEAYQKAIKNYDSMMERSSNSIGEVRA